MDVFGASAFPFGFDVVVYQEVGHHRFEFIGGEGAARATNTSVGFFEKWLCVLTRHVFHAQMASNQRMSSRTGVLQLNYPALFGPSSGKDQIARRPDNFPRRSEWLQLERR